MRRIPSVATLALLFVSSVAVANPALAQDARILTRPDARRVFTFTDDRPMIGVTTASGSERADTLGLRIDEVTKDSPAEKAGLKVGDRLQSVNGVSLRADRADAGEPDYTGVLNRRLQREVQKTTAGDALELRVFSGGQSRTVRVTPEKASDVMETSRGESAWRSMASDRAVIGVSITTTGSIRDTLGVFVMQVTKDGPAEKAGIVEGDRIAAINGVSLRVAKEDAEDAELGASRVERLQREVSKLEAGQAAELTVISGGLSRTVRVNAVKASDLPTSPRLEFFDVPRGGTYQFRSPRTPDGEVFEFRAPDARMRELTPRLEELQRRLQTERGMMRVSPRSATRSSVRVGI